MHRAADEAPQPRRPWEFTGGQHLSRDSTGHAGHGLHPVTPRVMGPRKSPATVPWSAELLRRGWTFRRHSENSWAQLRPEDTSPALPEHGVGHHSRHRPHSGRPGQETACPGLCWPPSRPERAVPRPLWPCGREDVLSPTQRNVLASPGACAGRAPSVGRAVWRPSPRVAGGHPEGRSQLWTPHRGSHRPRIRRLRDARRQNPARRPLRPETLPRSQTVPSQPVPSWTLGAQFSFMLSSNSGFERSSGIAPPAMPSCSPQQAGRPRAASLMPRDRRPAARHARLPVCVCVAGGLGGRGRVRGTLAPSHCPLRLDAPRGLCPSPAKISLVLRAGPHVLALSPNAPSPSPASAHHPPRSRPRGAGSTRA